jgi:hypothetical protein
MIADFYTPIAPNGWLELDGSILSASFYSALYSALTIQQTGSRGSSSALITGLSSTANMRAGYYVFGAGIASGTQIQSVDSATQITMTGTASSSGTSTVIVSPCLLNTGTFQLPSVSATGRYRRSRTSVNPIGTLQADSIASHLHAVSITSGNESANHVHTGTTDAETGHVHSGGQAGAQDGKIGGAAAGSAAGNIWFGNATNTDAATTNHVHTFTTNLTGTNHNHVVNGNTASTGSVETRPMTLVCMTCIKT